MTEILEVKKNRQFICLFRFALFTGLKDELILLRGEVLMLSSLDELLIMITQ